jgi:hypothetical protein
MSLATVGPWILRLSYPGSLAQFDASNGTLIACNADILVSSGPHGRLLGELVALQEYEKEWHKTKTKSIE